MRMASFILLACSSCSVALAQTGTATFRPEVVRTHVLPPHPSYFVENSLTNRFPPASLPLQLTVSPEGKVTAVELGQSHGVSMPDPATYDWQAIRETALQWRFVPFTVEGKPVTANIEEWVALVGPRRQPTKHVDPPVLKPDSDIVITLQRTLCYGFCPAYTLRLDSHSIRYEGTSSTVVEGVHNDIADSAAVRQLAKRFLDADFYSFADEYTAPVTDLPTDTISISIDGRTKSIADYGGIAVGMPFAVSDLEGAVDILAHSDRWVLGREGLVQSLKSEGYDFHTTDAQGILQRAIGADQAKTVEELLQAGVPLDVLPNAQPPAKAWDFDPTNLQWLSYASDAPEVMPVLLRAHASEHNQKDKDFALGNAAGFGDLDMVQALIRYGANPKATFEMPNPKNFATGPSTQPVSNGSVLTRAATSGDPAVLHEILQYRPDLEAKDSRGRTALFAAAAGHNGQLHEAAQRVECLKLLAAAGADPQRARQQR